MWKCLSLDSFPSAKLSGSFSLIWFLLFFPSKLSFTPFSMFFYTICILLTPFLERRDFTNHEGLPLFYFALFILFFSLFDPSLISAISCVFERQIDSHTLLSELFLALRWSKPFFRSLSVLRLPNLQTSKVLEIVALSQLILCLLTVFLFHINQYLSLGHSIELAYYQILNYCFGGHVSRLYMSADSFGPVSRIWYSWPLDIVFGIWILE